MIAKNISNLTDARYFSAWMPEALILKPTSNIVEVKQMLDAFTPWIEGVTWGVELISDPNQEYCEELCLLEEVEILLFENKSLPLVHHLPIRKLMWANNDAPPVLPADIPLLIDLSQSHLLEAKNERWIELHEASDWIKLQNQIMSYSGVVLTGGKEEKVGYKSFEVLDEIMNLLRQ